MSEIWPPLWLALAFVVMTAVALALRAGVLVTLRRWAGPGAIGGVVAAIRGPSLLWCVVLGLYAANEVALDATSLPVRWHDRVEMLLEAVLVLSVTVVLAGMAGHAVARVSERTGLSASVARLAQTTARVGLLVVGLIVLLSALGVQIAPSNWPESVYSRSMPCPASRPSQHRPPRPSCVSAEVLGGERIGHDHLRNGRTE